MYLILGLGISLLASISWASDDAQTFKVARMRGEAERSHVSNPAARSKLRVSDVLKPGDRVLTGTDQEVDLEATDGSRILVTENTALEITSDPNAIQTLVLTSGKVAGNAVKRPPSTVPAAKLKPYRFLIRTKTATMGVRGTQFVVESSEEQGGKSSFYVIEGVVEIAKDVGSLLTDNIVVAQAGQLVESASDGVGFVADKAKSATTTATGWVDDGVQGLSAAMPFDVFAFLSEMNSHLPDEFHIPFFTKSNPEEETESVKPPRPLRLASFEFYSQGYFATKGLPANRESHGLGLSWNPTLRLIERQYDLRFHIGLPRLFQGAPEAFNDWEFKVLATRVTRSLLFVEAGPVLQLYRNGYLGAGLSGTGGIWFGDRPLFRMLDRFFFGINWIASPFPSLEYRFGMGVRFY